MNNPSLAFIFWNTLLCASCLEAAWARTPPHQVILDPGHGGHDNGAEFEVLGVKGSEKTLTLQIAQNVSSLLQKKGYWVTLTRDKDVAVSLQERTQLANQLKADLFLSIHMNTAKPNRYLSSPHLNGPQGIETFVLPSQTDASSKRLANLQNKGKGVLDPLSSQTPEVALILKDLQLDAKRNSSHKLACHIQKNLVLTTHQLRYLAPYTVLSATKQNRGVKQAFFHVLLGANMPSALVEVGFLSHSWDRLLLLSPWGQEKISQAIAQGIQDYFHRPFCQLNGLEL